MIVDMSITIVVMGYYDGCITIIMIIVIIVIVPIIKVHGLGREDVGGLEW